MKKIITILILCASLNSAYAGDNILCNMFMKYHMTMANQGIKAIEKINSFFSTDQKQCDASGNSFEKLIHGLIDQDDAKITQSLKVIKENPLVKMVNKIMQKEGAKSLEDFILENKDKFNRLSEKEKSVVKEHPYKGLVVLYMYDFAEKFVQKNDDDLEGEIFEGPHGSSFQGTKDAYRHMMINAMAARFGMEEVTLKMGIAHEVSGGGPVLLKGDKSSKFDEKIYDKYFDPDYKAVLECNPKVAVEEIEKELFKKVNHKYTDNSMDLHNNLLGVQIGQSHQCASIQEISKLVEEKIKNGSAKIVSQRADCKHELVAANDLKRVDPSAYSDCSNPMRLNDAFISDDGKVECETNNPEEEAHSMGSGTLTGNAIGNGGGIISSGGSSAETTAPFLPFSSSDTEEKLIGPVLVEPSEVENLEGKKKKGSKSQSSKPQNTKGQYF